MTEETRQPRPYDSVLGGHTPDLSTSAVLGGLEGVIRNLQNESETVKLEALKKALEYGEAGLDLVIKALLDSTLRDPFGSQTIKRTAYYLLKDRTEIQVLKALKNFNNFSIFECLWTRNAGNSHFVDSLIVTRDNKYIVSAYLDKTIKIWDIKTGQCLHTLKDHLGWLESVIVTTDNKYIVSGSYDNTIKIWDFKTGRCLQTLKDHLGTVNVTVHGGKGSIEGADSLCRAA